MKTCFNFSSRFERSSSPDSVIVIRSGRAAEEMKSLAVISVRVILSSPRPIPLISAFPPNRSTFRTYCIDDWECAYTKECEPKEEFHSGESLGAIFWHSASAKVVRGYIE